MIYWKEGHRRSTSRFPATCEKTGTAKVATCATTTPGSWAAKIQWGDVREKGLRWYQGFRILRWERRIFQLRKQASDLPQNVSSPQMLRKDSSASTSSQSLGVSACSCQDSLLHQPRGVCSQLKCWGRTHMLEGFTRGPGASQVLAPDPGC